MTYDASERSRHGGRPIEFYQFSQDVNFYRYTSADGTQSYLGEDYAPESITRSAQDFSQEDTASNVTVRVPRLNAVAQLYAAYNPATSVYLTIFRKHRDDSETIAEWVGKVVSCAFEDTEAALTCAPISEAFKRTVPTLTYQSICNWALFGAGCGLDKEDFRESAPLLAVSGVTIQAAEFDTFDDGYFTNGWIQRSNGQRRFIVDHVGDTITLVAPFVSLAPAEVVDAFPGCMRTMAVCKAKYNNLDNHMGFPFVPNRDPLSQSIV